MQQIAGNFSYGFTEKNMASIMTLQDDAAMSISFIVQPDGSLQANYQLGPYTVKNMASQSQIVAMVPASARIDQCGYADLGIATSQGGGIVPVVSTHCGMSSTATARFYSTAVVPNDDPKGYYYIDLGFRWSKPIISSQGIGSKVVDLLYQGQYSNDPTGHFYPADTTILNYDKTNAPAGSPRGVYLKYVPGSSETVTNTSPPPNTTSAPPNLTGADTQIWISNASHPTYDISVSTENNNVRDIFQYTEQGVFLIIGAVIGAVFPLLLRRTNVE
jgi:hypothetical protein